jgi:hypothetical protein
LRIVSNLWRIGRIQHVLFRPIQSVPIGPSNQSKHVLLIFRSLKHGDENKSNMSCRFGKISTR